ncbi:MAG: hypothetical protein R2864_06825 [Syntrophotaleaceae bacterium]
MIALVEGENGETLAEDFGWVSPVFLATEQAMQNDQRRTVAEFFEG